jgi:hypothetical protein
MTESQSPLTMLFSRHTKRREFITLLGGAAAAWPLAARAQQSSLALLGVLMAGAATTLTKELDTFRNALRDLGYIEGRNVRFEYRFADGDLGRLPGLAAELVQLNPNIIVPSASSRAISPRIYRSCNRPSWSWSSTTKPRGFWASPCRTSCSQLPTR